MLGLYIQTPVKAPVEMLARFDAYRSEFAEDMEALTNEDFSRIKAGVITTLTEPPKNLSDEAAPFISDWTRERYDFDTRARLIAAVEAVTLQEARAYYRDTMLAEDRRGNFDSAQRNHVCRGHPSPRCPEAVVVEDVGAFHRQMPTQKR